MSTPAARRAARLKDPTIAIDLRQLEAFRAVMRVGSVTDAASALRLSQPAVSKLLAKLERTSGLRLFHRLKNRLEATPEALALYREVARNMIGMDDIALAVQSIAERAAGHLRIACLPSLALSFMPKVMRRFLAEHPQTTFTMVVREAGSAQEWVASQQYDLGLMLRFSESPEVTAETFANTAAVCVFPQGHALGTVSVIRPGDLADLPLITAPPGYIARARADAIFERTKTPCRIVVETNLAWTFCAPVHEGLGVALVNRFLARDHVRRGLLLARPFHPTVPIRILLVRPRVRPPSRLALRFVEALKAVRDEEFADDSSMEAAATAPRRLLDQGRGTAPLRSSDLAGDVIFSAPTRRSGEI